MATEIEDKRINSGEKAPTGPIVPTEPVNSGEVVGESNATNVTTGNSVSGGGSTTTKKTTTISGPYSQFRGSNYDDVSNYIRTEMAKIPEESDKEREKREKREKRLKFLAGLADGLGSFHTAYSYARGIKPMDLPNMSANLRKRFEKEKEARDKNRDLRMNYLITLANMKDKDRDFNFKLTEAEQQQNNWQQQYDANRKDRADDVEFRNKKFDKDNEHWQSQFDEGKRQFDITSKEQARHNKASEGIARQRLAQSQDGKYTEFYTETGMVRVPNSRLNHHNISYVYSKTPSAGRPTGGFDIKTGKTTPVSADQMMDWIGANIEDSNVQSALWAIGGKTEKKSLPGNENNKKKRLP